MRESTSAYDNWLQCVLDERGVTCPNCSTWRILDPEHPREIEKCPSCGDNNFDVYNLTEITIPVHTRSRE